MRLGGSRRTSHASAAQRAERRGARLGKQKRRGASRGWINGEYKHCTNVNAKNDEPYLLCDDANLEERGKVFKVRFYGRTYKPELPFETTFE